MPGGEEILWPVEWSQDGVVRLTERIQPGAVTPHAFGRDLAFLTRTLSPSSSKMTALTSGDEQRFLDHRTAKKLAPKTINVDVKIIRGALNAARCQGLVPPNPAEAVSMERGTFTPAEVKLLVDTAAGEWKLLILLAYFTGARLSDFARMQWEGEDSGEGTLTYTQAKTGAKVTTPLHPDLLARLNTLAGTDKAKPPPEPASSISRSKA